jgi:acyl dehydratase
MPGPSPARVKVFQPIVLTAAAASETSLAKALAKGALTYRVAMGKVIMILKGHFALY